MIGTMDKIKLLEKILNKSSSVTVESSDDPSFKSWKHLVEVNLIKVFGKNSPEFEHFEGLYFNAGLAFAFTGNRSVPNHIKYFREDFAILQNAIRQYIEDLEDIAESTNISNIEKIEGAITKVFISHASKDSKVVEDMIDVLETIGLDSEQIFCTSFDGYGIELGENYLDSLKNELSSDSLVIFILSKKFYESPVCLCEMGATWVLAKEHIPVLIPPFDYSDFQAVIPLTQGFKINDPSKLNLFKEKIEKVFNLKNTMSMSSWERKRDRILGRIEQNIIP